ncbi:E1-E2 ATPase family protein (macronuclear) [Tetrahymena thermophila SB210]|uniref:E1-E2 ATPase family protein n=1 Tax=Tetrahymena thermophila (strain SB210) TaxID=312017 RepID=Q23WN0_TETTS|nr:E1-E2 ATPase family protein [Tetrahymena thermophila SB210]EAS00950.3 E1-E2 ATPase family protein [Tetrahymena thermophila SB210]|eukprot:XP_001021195.3 E1-E2 ATPase family protein [Tetrahymena thermophila SB210]
MCIIYIWLIFLKLHKLISKNNLKKRVIQNKKTQINRTIYLYYFKLYQKMLTEQLCQPNQDYIEVVHSSVEGELQLKKVTPLKRSNLAYVFYLILCFLSCGIIYVVSVLWPKIFKKLVFKEVKSPYEATHVYAIGVNGEEFYEKIEQDYFSQSKVPSQPFFINRFMKYVYNENQNTFQANQYELDGKCISEISQSQPLNSDDISDMLKYYGHSFIDIIIPRYHEFLITELLRPINFLLYFGLAVWILELRFSFFAITLVSTIIIINIVCFFVRRTKQQLREACLHDELISVERSNEMQQVSSKNVVPGDIIHINKSFRVPFDCLILEGQLQVNEANITGEAIPISKLPLSGKSSERFQLSSQSAHILYEGTTIIQLEDSSAKLMVIRAGFQSYKGQIVRSLLHPKPVDKMIFIQGIKFVFAILFLAYIAYFATLYKLIQIEMLTKDIIYRFFDVLIYCAPPGAPLLINGVIFFSLIRLRYKKIFASDPSKALQAGRIKTICFDKTGTLTESTVNMQGYQLPLSKSKEEVIQNGDKKSILYKLLSSCHQAVITSEGKLGGDPIDVEIFQYSQWKLGHDNERKQNYSELNDSDILKLYTLSINEFHSEHQSMSVVVQEELNGSPQNLYLFMKGSPEVVLQKCNEATNEKSKLKSQFEALASQGYRVLGLAYKQISSDELEGFLNQKREDQEKNLTLLAFAIFKNNLKSDTAHVIKQLQDTKYNIKIISGDNPLTTLRIAEEANIISKEKSTILIDWVNRSQKKLQLTRYGTNDSNSFDTQTQSIDLTIKEDYFTLVQYCEQSINGSINICVSGHTHTFFEELIRRYDEKFISNESDSAKNSSYQNNESNLINLYKTIVLSSQLFARTSPSQKASIVKLIKDSGEVVCMVGDGTNDSPAIREADVGISFSDADGQFSAPYIAKDSSLECVISIILEGRVSLGVSLEIFIGYIQVSILRFIGFQSLSYFYSGFGDFQMSFQAYICGFVIVYFFQGLTKPVKNIKNCYINDNFFSAQYLISSISGFIIQSLSIIVGLATLQASSIYIEVNGFDTDKKFVFECQQNTIIFMFSLIHYFYIHISNNIGYPIKQPWYKNYVVLFLMLIQFGYGCLIMFTSKLYINPLKLVELDDNTLRLSLFFIFNGFGILQVLIEKVVIQTYILRYHQKIAQKQFQQKYIKLIQQLKEQNHFIYNS